MPLPFIIAGAVLAAGYGVKKGVDAKDDFDTADKYNRWARETYDEAKERLEKEKSYTNSKLESLGKLKVSIYDKNSGSLPNFVTLFEKIKNVDFKNEVDLNFKYNINKEDMLNIKDSVLKMQEVLGGTAAALGSGALAGFGALGGVGMLASASTGTAIASLSGVAATNATLAWLGGGSLAAGGFGMAGGMAVLGGVIAGPVLAVGGMMMASKAEEAKHTASANYDKAKIAAEQMDSACAVLDGIYWRADEMLNVLATLNEIFVNNIEKLAVVLDRTVYYNNFSRDEKKLLAITASTAATVKNVCDTPIIDKDGKVYEKSKEVLDEAKKITQEIQKV